MHLTLKENQILTKITERFIALVDYNRYVLVFMQFLRLRIVHRRSINTQKSSCPHRYHVLIL